MVKPNFWIDKTPKDSSQIAGTQLTQSDRWSSAVITEQVDATNVAAHLAESTEPDVVVPSESGVSAIGATVRAFRDSSGRVTHVSIPDSIPEGASTFSVGVTGERLVQLDATTAATQAQLDAAQQELDAARARLNDPETGLDAVQSRANDAVRDAAQAMVDASNAALAAVPPFIQAATPSATVVGQLWFPLDTNGRVIGMKRANATGTSGWVDYLMMAGKILVPGSVGTISLGDGTVTAPKIDATEELWAKLLNVAGNATIGGNLLAQNIAGKTILGALIEGGEFLMRGSEGGSTTTGTLTNFTGDATNELKPWPSKPNLSIASGGRSGNCLRAAPTAFPDKNSPTGYSLGVNASVVIVPLTGGNVSAWNLGAIPQTGITTVEAWVKPSQACQVNFGIVFENASGNTIAVTQSFQLPANVYSRVAVTGPSGYRPRIPGTLSVYVLMTLEVPYFNATQGQTMTVLFDDLTWTNTPDTASALHIYRDKGTPTLDLIDYQGILRARLSAPSSGNAGLSFFSNDGDAMTFAGDGLYGTKAGPDQTPTLLSSWEDIRANTRQEDVRDKISTVDGSNIRSTVASALMLGERIIFANIKINLKARTTISGWQVVQIGQVAAGYRPAELALFTIAWQPNIVLGVDVDGKVFLQSNTAGATFNNGETYRIPANWVTA